MTPAPPRHRRTPRAVAARVLGEVRRRDAYAVAVLDTALAGAGLEPRDVALVTRLVYGTLGYQGTLDEALDRFLDNPGGIEPPVRDALRAAAYELLFMRSPAHAAVNEWVEIVKRSRPRAGGVANAVLRKLAEAATDFPWGDPATDLDALARATGHPRWLVDRLMEDLGPEIATGVLRADDGTAPLYLWVNPFKATVARAVAALERDGAEPEECYQPGCVRARHAGAAVRGEAVADGLAIVTDAAAQVAALAVGGHPGRIVVDAASGRGTKTAELQAVSVAAGGAAQVVALDVHGFKTRLAAERMERLGVPGVTASVADAADPSAGPDAPAQGSAAAVLLDAPCSGSGTLRRHPEKRWRLAPEDIEEMAALQARLVQGVSSLVEPGGRLVYATCSIVRAENDAVVDGFLGSPSGEGFEPVDLAEVLPEAWRPNVGEDGRFRTFPAPHGPDGHFVAALRRRP